VHLAKVMGSVVATRKVAHLEGVKLLLVQPLNQKLKPMGKPLVAVDTVRAGTGDLVYYVIGREASMALAETFVPIDAAIVGIVDQVSPIGEEDSSGGSSR